MPEKLPRGRNPAHPWVGQLEGREAHWAAPQEMSWPTNYSTSFQPVGNCWKSRDYFKSRNSVATFADTSGDLCFWFFGILLMISGEKFGGFLFFLGRSLTNSLAAELFLLERWKLG